VYGRIVPVEKPCEEYKPYGRIDEIDQPFPDGRVRANKYCEGRDGKKRKEGPKVIRVDEKNRYRKA
jgi:hypothetical protein